MGIARAETPLTTVRVAQGLSMPLYVTAPPGDTTRLFIVEQRGADNRGRIKILRNGSVLLRPFLTTDVLAGGSEQGLLGLAFAPDYATTGRFYINYTRADGTTIVARHTVSADPDSAIPAGTVILSIAQPFANHNGGWLGFGPDGFLYISSGDGGSGGDPGDRAQNLSTLLGKILRIDVSGASYTIPSDNPFQGATPGLDEIWAYGLRNPWRCAFDRETGDLVIADVGQSQREEVNFQPASSGGGENYGWRCYEGTLFFSESANIPCGSCLASGCPKIFPLHEYPHSLGRCSITGGYIYRGCAVPDLRGTYFFADYCAGTIYSGRFQGGTFVGLRDRTAGLAPGGGLAIGLITSFGEDARGELYICDQGGEVFKVVPKSPVLEADMPTLRERTALGDSLGSTAPGNALLTGIVPFASTGSRIRGVGYLKDAVIRGCAVISGKCLTSRVRLDPFDIDLDACVDSAANTVTRRFVFTNTAPGPRALAYVDVITPRLRGDPDGATTTAPAGSGSSAVLVQYDSFAPDRWIVHSGSGSTGVTYSADVDTASQLTARVGADQPLAGGSSAGPAEVGLALGFDFGSLAPAARETVVVVTTLQASAPSAVATETASIPNIQLRVLGRIPFRSALQIEIGLARAQRVSLDLFDLAGRRVRAVARWVLPAGKRVVRWDGKLDGGADAPSGVYFIRLATETAVATRRVVLVR
jgi:hypothetical protein